MAKKQTPTGFVPVTMTECRGINNVQPAERLKPGELSTAVNVDITFSRQIVTRQGMDRVYTGSPHSLFSNGRHGSATLRLFREGEYLMKLNADYTAAVLRTGITRSAWMHYLTLNGLVYYTDESILGITDGTTDRSWGITVPNPILLTSYSNGGLSEGTYLATCTLVRSDGQESGAPPPVSVYLPAKDMGVRFSGLPTSSDPDITGANLYLSTRNGELLYKVAHIGLGSDPVLYQGDCTEFTTPLATLNMGPPIAGHNIQFYNGRLFICSGNFVLYSLPYNYELFDRAHGFLAFPDRVTLFAPVNGGIWVAVKNERTFFLRGDDPDKFQIAKETEYWAHEGSQQYDEIVVGEEVSSGWFWTADNGIYMGLDDGTLLHKTENRYRPGVADLAVSTIKKTRDGSKQYVSVLY